MDAAIFLVACNVGLTEAGEHQQLGQQTSSGLVHGGPRRLSPGNASTVDFSCDFDTNNCGFENTGAKDWTRRSGSTPSAGTGPEGDHTDGTGSYVYVEASTNTP